MDVVCFVTAVISYTAILRNEKKKKSIQQDDNVDETNATATISSKEIKETTNTNNNNNRNLLIPIEALKDGTSLNAKELICTVSSNNIPTKTGHIRSEMRLLNLWHRATYILIKHINNNNSNNNNEEYILVQRRSMEKDYCPGKLDPTPGGVVGYNESYKDNAIRELEEEMGISNIIFNNNDDNDTTTANDDDDNDKNTIMNRMFTFSYQDEHVKVWGEFYEVLYYGSINDLKIQEEEVDEVIPTSINELKIKIESDDSKNLFMPDSIHAMKLYFQRLYDKKINRKLLKGYSSSDLDKYNLRPKPQVIFFDCDDCLYFDNWIVANELTKKIDDWCTRNANLPTGKAYELYKQYGTALRGLLAEGYINNTPHAIDEFLSDVHDLPIHDMIKPDPKLRQLLLNIDPTIPKFIFTASVSHHARNCLKALGIDDIFPTDDCIIDVKKCNLNTKHSIKSFEIAMEHAGITNPEVCIFFDDSIKNIEAARQFGWRSILVGKIGRDCGKLITSNDAELEINSIHEFDTLLPELFRGMN